LRAAARRWRSSGFIICSNRESKVAYDQSELA